MCPKIKKSIEEVQEESRTILQPKVINHVIQEQPNTHKKYYPIHYNHSQVMLPGPPSSYNNYEPIAMYHPMQNQWRQAHPQQSNVKSTQPEALVANNNHQNNQSKQENNSLVESIVNANTIIPSRGRILTITGGYPKNW